MTYPSAGGVHPESVGGRIPRRRHKPIEGAYVIKDRIEVAAEGTAAVVDSKPGAVTKLDKVKAYYHTLIIALTGILASLTEVGPIGNVLGDPLKTYVAGAIVALGIVVTLLKSNEVWIERL